MSTITTNNNQYQVTQDEYDAAMDHVKARARNERHRNYSKNLTFDTEEISTIGRLVKQLSFDELVSRVGKPFVIKSQEFEITGTVDWASDTFTHVVHLRYNFNGYVRHLTVPVPHNSVAGQMARDIRKALIEDIATILTDDWVKDNYTEIMDNALPTPSE
jgi:hypothetical protein